MSAAPPALTSAVPHAAPADWTLPDLAGLIDHALLAPTLTAADYAAGCDLAAAYQVASVCVSPHAVRDCAARLAGTGVKVGTVVGFPHGLNTTAVKRAEAEAALADGAVELDMVVNISRVLSGDWDHVERDIAAVCAAARSVGGKTKTIFETCYLDDAQKARLCAIAGVAGADWVKTSTGFGTAGATDPRPEVDATARPAGRGGEGQRRHQNAGPIIGGAGAGRHPGRPERHRGGAGRGLRPARPAAPVDGGGAGRRAVLTRRVSEGRAQPGAGLADGPPRGCAAALADASGW